VSKLVVAAERTVNDSMAIVRKIAFAAVNFGGGEVAVRGPRSGGPTGSVEHEAIEIARAVDARPVIYTAAESEDSRAATFNRDYELVTGADLVLAFFLEGSDMGGGTGHVIKAAIDRDIAVEAFSVDAEGELEYLFADGGWKDRGGDCE
jgi:hypothetical protein